MDWNVALLLYLIYQLSLAHGKYTVWNKALLGFKSWKWNSEIRHKLCLNCDSDMEKKENNDNISKAK
jgi:hypothetical protein